MLNIVVGPMCAGKTTQLIDDYNSMDCSKMIIDFEIGEKELVYASQITTHSNIKAPCYKSKKLFDLLDIYKHFGNFQMSHEFNHINNYIDSPEMHQIHDELLTVKAIFINEAQFFPDLYEFVLKFIHKKIYIYGLDGDFQKNKMGQILDLVPHCDNIIKLKAKCICGKDAIFTYRDSPETIQYLPNANYIPLCRACFSNKKK
jgi:thymidine kinase